MRRTKKGALPLMVAQFRIASCILNTTKNLVFAFISMYAKSALVHYVYHVGSDSNSIQGDAALSSNGVNPDQSPPQSQGLRQATSHLSQYQKTPAVVRSLVRAR